MKERYYNYFGWFLMIMSGVFIISTRVWQFFIRPEHTEMMMLETFGGIYIMCILSIILGCYLIERK